MKNGSVRGSGGQFIPGDERFAIVWLHCVRGVRRAFALDLDHPHGILADAGG
ncbi:hypothetical protein [Burkholderia lata]|uniref:hypothetical protein n=1 Tax=Burkholderia lata (strain ATCC 17760 / DSM 23089 / LMG 22485 / NCIMB 9086 / R18194 / 383) TaxID=482957 RepID=UPI0015816781|nr:hypothetical protein [Burkholderia lata]